MGGHFLLEIHPPAPPPLAMASVSHELACFLSLFLSFFLSFFLSLFLSFFLSFFRAAPAAYESSQARGPIRAIAPGLHHSHGNTGSLTR